MKIAVLGAGIVGATTAYQLVEDGHEVVLVDRQPAVAQECSYANGGYVAISQAVPWSAPGVPTKTLLTMLRPDAPILLHPSELPKMWRWGLNFIADSRAAVSWENTKRVLRLALYSFEILKKVRDKEAIDYRQRANGTLKVFADQKTLDEAAGVSEAQRELGLNFRVCDQRACLELAPALRPSIERLAGGIYYPDEECGDCRGFAEAVVAIARQRGAVVRFGAAIERLVFEGDSVVAVETSTGRIEADRFVLAAGAASALIMAAHATRLPIIPVKGYSFTVSREPWADAPELPVLDEAGKHGLMPLGPNHVRLTGYAEIAGFDTTPRERRKAAFIRSFTRLFPQLEACFALPHEDAICCLRPVTPSGLPILGRSRFENLHYNVGHGHLGWTLANGSARIVADQILGKTPEIDIDGYLPKPGQ